MTNTEVVTLIIELTQDFLIFMLPVIGVLSGISFILTFLFSITMGLGKRTFKG